MRSTIIENMQRDGLKEFSVEWLEKQFELPDDINLQVQKLKKTHEEATNFKKLSDGMFCGIGLDAGIGLIPVIGGIYTVLGGMWLTTLAIRARCSFGTIASCVVLTLLDLIIGVFVGAGDVLDAFFRSHAWAATRIMSEIESKLEHINHTKGVYVRAWGATPNDPRLTEMRNVLFRDGQTESQYWMKWAIPVGIVLFLFVTCS
ncbi:MAG: DUF4112 domain-containing protein [Alphaproteobacteria bacterium]